jgi:hypothetical protein
MCESKTFEQKKFAYLLAASLRSKQQYSVLNYSPPKSEAVHDVFIPSYPRMLVRILDSNTYTDGNSIQSVIERQLNEHSENKTYDCEFFVILDDNGRVTKEEVHEIITSTSCSKITLAQSFRGRSEDIENIALLIFHARKGYLTPRTIPLDECSSSTEFELQLPLQIKEVEKSKNAITVSVNHEEGRYYVLDGRDVFDAATSRDQKEISAYVITSMMPETWDVKLVEPKQPRRRNRQPTRATNMASNVMFSMINTPPMHDSFEDADDVYELSLVEAIRPELEGLISIIEKKDIADVLLFEYNMLKKEHEEEHFTSCGLRVGRLLESVIFSMGKNWDVELEKPKIEKLVKMDAILREIESHYIQFITADESRAESLKIKLNRSIENLQKNIMQFTFAAGGGFSNEDLSKKDFKLARTVLMDIRKKFAKLDGVTQAFGGNQLVETYNRIHTIRNQAAHADIDLKPRELSRDDVNDMLVTIREMMQKLVNIGVAVKESQP